MTDNVFCKLCKEEVKERNDYQKNKTHKTNKQTNKQTNANKQTQTSHKQTNKPNKKSYHRMYNLQEARYTKYQFGTKKRESTTQTPSPCYRVATAWPQHAGREDETEVLGIGRYFLVRHGGNPCIGLSKIRNHFEIIIIIIIIIINQKKKKK